MKLRVSGGIGLSYSAEVDLSRLPAELRNQVQNKLNNQYISKQKIIDKNLNSVDGLCYDVSFDSSDDRVLVNEAESSDEIIELIDKLGPYLKILPRST